jgi:hypothetical protein
MQHLADQESVQGFKRYWTQEIFRGMSIYPLHKGYSQRLDKRFYCPLPKAHHLFLSIAAQDEEYDYQKTCFAVFCFNG